MRVPCRPDIFDIVPLRQARVSGGSPLTHSQPRRPPDRAGGKTPWNPNVSPRTIGGAFFPGVSFFFFRNGSRWAGFLFGDRQHFSSAQPPTFPPEAEILFSFIVGPPFVFIVDAVVAPFRPDFFCSLPGNSSPTTARRDLVVSLPRNGLFFGAENASQKRLILIFGTSLRMTDGFGSVTSVMVTSPVIGMRVRAHLHSIRDPMRGFFSIDRPLATFFLSEH